MASHQRDWAGSGAIGRARLSSIFSPPVLLILACAILGILAGALAAWLPGVIILIGIVGVIAAAVLTQRLQWDVWLLALVLTLLPFGALRLGIGFNPSFLNLAYILIIVAWALWLFGERLAPPLTPPPPLPLGGEGGKTPLTPRAPFPLGGEGGKRHLSPLHPSPVLGEGQVLGVSPLRHFRRNITWRGNAQKG